ncbi:MAG TPA: FtsX-like permease family protein, partial [Rhodopila sp.]
NGRRSFMTAALVAMGSLALLLFGGFVTNIFAGLETGIVQNGGHLTVYRHGYFLFGPGNPAAYGVDDHAALMHEIEADPVLHGMIQAITATQSLVGIAGNFSGGASASKTFFGIGLIGADREKMRKWNDYAAGRVYPPDDRLSDPSAARGVIGRGVARMLGLCAPLHVPNCPAPEALETVATNGAPPLDPGLADLARGEQGSDTAPDATPRIDLLSATAGGAPNIVSLAVAGVDIQAVKEIDDNYVAMPLALAQQLVYGRSTHKVTAIVLQLHHTADLPAARARLEAIISDKHLPLEVRDFRELNPFFVQVVGMFSVIFMFLAIIMGLIVLFAVVNTMTMNVLERTGEIGTVRAMGVRRSGIRRLFLLEGALLGALGASAGVVLAFVATWVINNAGLDWFPPGNTDPIPFRLAWPTGPALLLGSWLGLTLVATLATVPPSNRAARSRIVDALRHV